MVSSRSKRSPRFTRAIAPREYLAVLGLNETLDLGDEGQHLMLISWLPVVDRVATVFIRELIRDPRPAREAAAAAREHQRFPRRLQRGVLPVR